MTRAFIISLSVYCVLMLSSVPARAGEFLHHDIVVKLMPEERRLVVDDAVTLPDGKGRDVRLELHRGLNPSSPTPGVRIEREPGNRGSVTLESYRVVLPPGKKTFTLRYSGEIHHPVEAVGKETARGFGTTQGTISAEGVFLSGNSAWYPQFDDPLVSFTLQVELPPKWDS